MKKLRALALSDLHIGEKRGLLSNNDFGIRDITVEKIKALSTAEPNTGLDNGIEELILLGDIIELSEADDKLAYNYTKSFLDHLLNSVKVDRIIFIPGNHDHHLWLSIVCQKEHIEENEYSDVINSFSFPYTIENPPLFYELCLTDHDQPVKVCYPYHTIVEELSNDSLKPQFYLFDHGHLFSSLFKTLSKCWLMRQILGFKKNTEHVQSLRELEQNVNRFIEFVWHPKENQRQQIRGKIYDLQRKLKLNFLYNRGAPTTFIADYRTMLTRDLIDQIRWYLTDVCQLNPDFFYQRDFHFIFGHTHLGGREISADRKVRMISPFISIWNTGGWIVPSKVFSPEACIFYIERKDGRLWPNIYKLVKRIQIDGRPPIGDYDAQLLFKRQKA